MRRRPLLPLLLALLFGCAEPPPLNAVDQPAGDDDDSTLAPDDDDPEGLSSATFAATLYGELDDSSVGSGLVRTKIEGAFQFLYWAEDASTPECRQRFTFQGEGQFGPFVAGACGACSGRLAIQSVSVDTESERSDGCLDLGPADDLSFLLSGGPDGTPPDFRTLALVSLQLLDQLEFPLGIDGISAAEVIGSYADIGLEATYVAMVRPGGWLGTSAALGEVASAWDEFGWLPMFVVYKDLDRPGNGSYLEGEVFMTSLWQVALGRGGRGGQSPSQGGEALPD